MYLDSAAGVCNSLATTGHSAICMLEGTTFSTAPVSGYVHFIELEDSTLDVTILAHGLTDSPHTFHVHMFGDLNDATGNAVGGHFVGVCDHCRPSTQPQEAGLLNDGQAVPAVSGTMSYSFNEKVAKLSGPNSIIGRAVIIHGVMNATLTRVARCVIGRWTEPSGAPGTLRERCEFRAFVEVAVSVAAFRCASLQRCALPSHRRRVG